MKYLIEISEISVNERIRLAKETNDLGLLAVLSFDDYDAVRIGAAENPMATVEIINKLLTDPVWNVRLAALNHPNASKKIIKRLMSDENQYVKATALSKND